MSDPNTPQNREWQMVVDARARQRAKDRVNALLDPGDSRPAVTGHLSESDIDNAIASVHRAAGMEKLKLARQMEDECAGPSGPSASSAQVSSAVPAFVTTSPPIEPHFMTTPEVKSRRSADVALYREKVYKAVLASQEVPRFNEEPVEPADFAASNVEDTSDAMDSEERGSLGMVAKAEKKLHVAAERVGMTREGENWFKQVTDPFHDRPLVTSGWPIPDGVASDILTIHKTFTVSSPRKDASDPTSPSAALWDLHVYTTPLMQSTVVGGTRNYGIGMQGMGITQGTDVGQSHQRTIGKMGTVTMVAVPAGRDTAPGFGDVFLSPTTTDDYTMHAVSPVDFVGGLDPEHTMDGRSRLVSGGFETAVTGVAIARAGNVVTYKQNAAIQDMNVGIANPDPQGPSAIVPNTYEDGALPARSHTWRAPPSTIRNALNRPGSGQWRATEGTYTVLDFNRSENPALQPEASRFLMLGQDNTPGRKNSANVGTFGSSYLSNGLTPFKAEPATIGIGGQIVGPFMNYAPIDTQGVYYQGLAGPSSSSDGTGNIGDVVTITVRFQVEIFPTNSELVALLLSRAPSPYDPVALEFYFRAKRGAPPSYRLNENPFGEAFSKIVGSVTKLMPMASKVLNVIPHPKAKMLGGAVDAIMGATKGLKREEKAIRDDFRGPQGLAESRPRLTKAQKKRRRQKRRSKRTE